jgi:cytochrome c556
MKQPAFWILMSAALLNSSSAFADGSGAIIARQACMKASTSAFNALLPMFKGEKPFDAAATPKAVNGIDFVCSDWAQFWPQDSQAVPGLKTRANEAVWSDAQGFQRSYDAYLVALKKLASSKDEPNFKANFAALGEACGACHKTYRSPEN